MSVARIQCRAQLGLVAPAVLVEVHLGSGLPMFTIVGLPAAAVKESKERVRAALANSGFDFPAGRITVNLAPADLPKDGGRFDLAIAIGILVASGQLASGRAEACEVYGELGLSGELRPVPGLLLAAAQATGAGRNLLVPQANAVELRAAPLPAVHARVFAAATLVGAVGHMSGANPLPSLQTATSASANPGAVDNVDPGANKIGPAAPDLADIVGQAPAKRALVIAAAGGHSVLLVGPPGCGKSMLAQRLPGILPPLDAAEHLEVATIRSVSGMLLDPASAGQRPFRAPHHTASASAIIGGGPNARPGEITLAHRGVLFLDELPEYDHRVREALREPLETGVIAITRAGVQCEYPARFQFIAAMNPCPCGFLGDPTGRCRCPSSSVARYQARISGPLLDRIDIRLQLTRVHEAEWQSQADARGAASAVAAAHVAAARDRQWRRAGVLNAALGVAQLNAVLALEADARRFLLAAVGKMQLSARAKQRVERVARTIADLEDCDTVALAHVGEALQLRRAF